MKLKPVLMLLGCLLAAACGEKQPAPAAANAGSPPPITVSGISSGGYMAGQFQVAYSADVDGAAIIAAGPWGCAQGELKRALGECLSGEGIDLDALRLRASAMAEAGTIDALEHLDTQRMLFFRGQKDAVIPEALVAAARTLLVADAGAERVLSVTEVPSAHGWVTDDFGGACDSFASPYIIDCDYDLAGRILEQLYGELEPPAAGTAALTIIDQSDFAEASLADTGFAYVPAACRSEACRVHVFFHGCEQSAETIGEVLAAESGFNAWAESNRLIVLYPQVAPSRIAPMNPLGCWDWWGYTGDDYLQKSGVQLAAIRALVDRVAGNSSP